MFALPGLGHTAAKQAQLPLHTPVERALDLKDAGHEFVVTRKGNQAFTITVQQQGIDIVVARTGREEDRRGRYTQLLLLHPRSRSSMISSAASISAATCSGGIGFPAESTTAFRADR